MTPDAVRPYTVTKLVRGIGGRWVAGRPTVFNDRIEALEYARAFAHEQSEARVKGARIVVTQGATLVREFKV